MSMIPVNRKFLRGDIYYANLEPHLGSEQGGIRPVVVVQNNTANCYSPNLIVAPVTSNTAKKPDHQAHVLVDSNRAFLQPSMILAESVQTISKGRLIRPMGRLSIPELIRLNYALLYQLDLNGYGERRPMNVICDTTAKSETISVKGCKVKITYAPADTDCLDAIQKLLQTTILRTAGHTAA